MYHIDEDDDDDDDDGDDDGDNAVLTMAAFPELPSRRNGSLMRIFLVVILAISS